MGRAYNVVDADGHVLEPLDLWDNYMEPRFRNRAPRLIKDKDGKERLVIEEQILGSAQAGLGGAGGVGARQGVVASNTMEYKEGRRGGFDPHARMPDMDADGIDAVFLYPTLGLFSGAIHDPELAAATCRAYNRWLAYYCKPYPDRLFGIANCSSAIAGFRSNPSRAACACWPIISAPTRSCGRRITRIPTASSPARPTWSGNSWKAHRQRHSSRSWPRAPRAFTG